MKFRKFVVQNSTFRDNFNENLNFVLKKINFFFIKIKNIIVLKINKRYICLKKYEVLKAYIYKK